MTLPRLGTLSWLPAADRPDLLATPVAQAVAARGPECWVAAIDPALADTAAFSEAYEVPLANSANCVVVIGRRGETTRMAACLVLASDRADVNKTVRKHLDVRKISFAAMEEAVSQTGMEYGGITPVGLPEGWPVLVDAAVAATDLVVIGSGIRGSKILLRGAAVAGLPTAQTLHLALPSSPVSPS